RAYCLKTQPATGETYPKSDLFNKATSNIYWCRPDNVISDGGAAIHQGFGAGVVRQRSSEKPAERNGWFFGRQR
ncbi:hypothetical protein, partial [Enterobacter kobei]|uniref:hypothetical protein n=2 Tax=Gammaproteobacteria TaxID=1236 RepID=UPI0038601461